MQKYIHCLILTVLLLTALPSHAVLKERDISSSLSILRQELNTYRHDLDKQQNDLRLQQQMVVKELITVGNQSQQNALMLYSQKEGNIFDLTYACHAATEQYKQFRNNAAPFRDYITNTNTEVSRYDSLINDLSNMYTGALTPKAKIDRNVCLTLAINIRRTLADNNDQMKQYITLYNRTEEGLKNLNDYANMRYGEIQRSIFNNGGENYIAILHDLNKEYHLTLSSVLMKYRPVHHALSEWDGRVILGFFIALFIGVLIATGLNYLIIGFIFTYLVKHGKIDFLFQWFDKRKASIQTSASSRKDENPSKEQEIDLRMVQSKASFTAKRRTIIATSTVITFALLLGLLRQTVAQNFFVMATGLLMEFAWLMAAILLSLLIRLDGVQIKNGLRIYAPVMTVCFLVIAFRIILIPNTLVNLIFPPMLLVCAVWQWRVVKHYQKRLPKSDVFYTTMSLIVFVFSVIASLIGYTLLSVEALIWWTMQLTCILTITCLSSMLKGYGNDPRRLFFDKNTSITRTWLFRFFYYALLPISGALSIILSIYWAADVFNLSDTTLQIFSMRLIDTKNFTFSIFKAVQVVILFYLFSYFCHTSLNLLHHHFAQSEHDHAIEENRREDPQAVVSRTAMWRNVIQVLVWGIWLMISMKIFNIDNSWIVAISAGLSTGIGFAMKDILENIYYGISLMAGRIRVGDYVSIDGTRGTVRNISYTSTMIEALDGSIISFQNSQLFTKNYKNLTKNHGYELAIIPVSVAYGSNVAEVKELAAAAVKRIERKNYIKYINTVFVNFGDNSIDFKVLAWVDSRKQIYATGEIYEALYNTLNEHQIEIPYPQRDVHIKSDSTMTQKETPKA
jgi:small-conductance mechanosensitive channel